VKIEDNFRQLIRKQVEYKVFHFSNDCLFDLDDWSE
jgi:hypothetical protein